MNRILIALLLVLPMALFAESNGTPESAPTPAPVSGGAPTTTTAHSADAPPAAGGGQAAKGGQSFDPTFLLIMAVPLALMWFMASRTQKKEERRKQELLSAIKRGDQVVTIGGAHGEVASVGESTVDVRLGKGDDAAVITFNKTAIATVAGVDAGKAK